MGGIKVKRSCLGSIVWRKSSITIDWVGLKLFVQSFFVQLLFILQFQQVQIRGRGWNRGNCQGNSSLSNPMNMAGPKKEDWDPEYTPKSKQYYLVGTMSYPNALISFISGLGVRLSNLVEACYSCVWHPSFLSPCLPSARWSRWGGTVQVDG